MLSLCIACSLVAGRPSCVCKAVSVAVPYSSGSSLFGQSNLQRAWHGKASVCDPYTNPCPLSSATQLVPASATSPFLAPTATRFPYTQLSSPSFGNHIRSVRNQLLGPILSSLSWRRATLLGSSYA